MSNFYRLFLLLAVVAFLVSYLYFFMYYIKGRDIAQQPTLVAKDTLFIVDTVFIYKERIKPKVVYLTKTDSIYFNNNINDTVSSYASLETKLETGDSLYVTYYFPPKNFFDVKLKMIDTVVMPIFSQENLVKKENNTKLIMAVISGFIVGATTMYFINKEIKR